MTTRKSGSLSGLAPAPSSGRRFVVPSRAGRALEARRRGLLLGHDTDGRPVRVPWADLYPHAVIAGGSGKGKSTSLLATILQMMIAEFPVVILDPKGDLAEAVLRLCYRLGKGPDQVVYIDPSASVVPGLPYLEVVPGSTPAATAKTALEGLAKVLREDTSTKVWLQEYGIATLTPLAAAGLSLAEVFAFVSTADPTFRNAVLARVEGRLGDTIYADRWRELAALKNTEQAIMTSAIRTRGALVRQSRALAATLGQCTSTIPWERLLRTRGSVVIANLAYSSTLSESEVRAIGVGILHRVSAVAWDRARVLPAARERVFVVCDESERFVTRDLATAYEKFRGYGISFACAFQHLDQLRAEDPLVASALIGDANFFQSFAVRRKDAEELCDEIWSGHLDLLEVKHELTQTKFAPEEVWRETRSKTKSGDERSPWAPTAWSETKAEAIGITHREFQETSSVTHWSKEEQYERAVGSLKRAGVGEATVAWSARRPQKIRTLMLPEVVVPQRSFDVWKRSVRDRYGRPVEEVLEELRTRVPQYVAESARLLASVARSRRKAMAASPPGATAPGRSAPTPPGGQLDLSDFTRPLGGPDDDT